MKKLFTLSFFSAMSCITFHAAAQLVTISATHQLPAIGDVVHYTNANTFGFDPVGVGPVTAKVWDESLLINTGPYDFTYVDPTTISPSLGKDSFPTATIARGESGATGYFYYQNTATDINRIGWFASASNYGIYTDGTFGTEFHFPIQAGQNVTTNYHGHYAPLGFGEDSVLIQLGNLSITADAQGTMILPTGSFTNVLRLHVLESFHIVPYIAGTPALDEIVSDDYYYWFHDTILQPLMTYGVTTVGGTAQTPVLRYQPLQGSTGLADNTSSIGSIFPNPSNGKFTVSSSTGSLAGYRVEVCNVLGEKIYSSELKGKSSQEINIVDPAKGVYFVKIYSGQRMQTEKMIIE